MTGDVHILLVDDHPVVRDAVHTRLEKVSRFKVVGEAGDIATALEQAETTRPDLALIDIGLGRRNGLVLVRALHARLPETRLIVWSMHANPEYVCEARGSGARAYVLKSGPVNEIVTAIEVVMAGGTYFSPGVDRTALPLPALTPTEKVVLRLVVEGLSSAEIGKNLKIDVRTVETHRRNVMVKLGTENTAQLVVLAIKLGLVDL